MLARSWFSLVYVLLAVSGFAQEAAKPKPVEVRPGLEHYLLGNAADARPKTSYGVLLMGGGKDVDEAFQWFIAKAGGGDIVILRASGTDAYNPYIKKLGAVDSVETLIIKSREAALEPLVAERLRQADGIFIAGGAQSNYVKFWGGTPVQRELEKAAQRGVPIGGTSAGLAVLGEFAFAALNGSTTSADVLSNPYHEDVTLERGFLTLPGLQGMLTDSHFVERDRLGRLVTFLARLKQDGRVQTARGLGIDRETALLLEADGKLSLRGKNTAYLLELKQAPERCQAGQPLTVRGFSVYRLSGAATFDLKSWRGTGGSAYQLEVLAGKLQNPHGALY